MAGLMRLVSVNVGLPSGIGRIQGKQIESAIGKRSVKGPVIVRKLNLDGDLQADLTVHGGEDKAVYAYPSEHYEYWKEKFPDRELPWGTFGENFTTQGLMEEYVRRGDRLRIGSAEFSVVRPRFPCFKLGLKFGTAAMERWFLESERTGFYLRVLQEGLVEEGNPIDLVRTDQDSETISSAVRAFKKNA